MSTTHAGRDSTFGRVVNLVEQAGLKGKRIGDAQISPKHANFIVNLGQAKASDVKALMDMARDAVLKQFGIELELEQELVGEWNG